MPKSAIDYNQKTNQRSCRIDEKRVAHRKRNTNRQLASLHNKHEERDNGDQNGGTRPKEVKHDGIDPSWGEDRTSSAMIVTISQNPHP